MEEKQSKIDWVDANELVPVSEYEQKGKGNYYFSECVFVKRGSRKYKAVYKISTGQWYLLKSSINITDQVKYWSYKD